MNFSTVAAAVAHAAREAMRQLRPILREAWMVLKPVVTDLAREVSRWWFTGRKAGENFSSVREKGPRMTDHHAPPGEVQEFRITFGMKYANEQHPAFPRAHPEGWLTILARSEDQARNLAWALIGPAWAFIYTEPFDEDRWSRDCPRGELARLDASLAAVDGNTFRPELVQ